MDVLAAPGARQIVLDTLGLTITSVTDNRGRALPWTLGKGDEELGLPLTVQLNGAKRIVVRYSSAPGARALQWLSPSLTAGKHKPYLFSQGQDINNRSWIPTQDSPGIRQTWSARIVVPEGVTAVMSGERLTPRGEATPEGKRAFRFRMDHSVPPYLIALAVGDLTFQELGPRTGVYTEPSMMPQAANELADTEKMVATAESLYGPYRWGRYDVLVLPPSFPYGGMENPTLTFLTPTFITGDKANVGLVAHELAHSWSGNLVTNATWPDGWLNEGFTTYFQNRIMEQLYGPERAQMLATIERQELQEELDRFSGTPRQTALYAYVQGQDPDANLSAVPYDKGAAFLRMLELHVGRERFDPWLRSYFERHAFGSITTPQFVEDLRATLLGNDAALERELRIREWLFEPGLPGNDTPPTSPTLERAAAEARRFADGSPAASLQTEGWATQQWQRFLATLPERLTGAQLADLDATLHLSERGNAEVLFLWLRIAIRNEYKPAYASLERFLTSQGRRKFVEPLFKALLDTPAGQTEARRIYARARPLYHTSARQALDVLLDPSSRPSRSH